MDAVSACAPSVMARSMSERPPQADLRVSSTQVSEVPPMRPEANREACEQIRANFKSRLCSPKVRLCYELDCQRPGRNQSVDVSYLAQTLDGQRRKRITIDTPSQRVRSSIRLAEPEPTRVSVSSLRNMSGERKYRATTCNSGRRISDASAARRSRRCCRNDGCRLLLGWLVGEQHR